MRKTLSVLFCLTAFTTNASASDKPPEIASVIKADAPSSTATYKLLFISIYDAELWTDGAWSWDKPFELSLTYQLDAPRKKIVDRSIDEMNNNTDSGPLDDAKSAQYREQLNKLIPNVKDGQRLSALYLPNKSLQFFLDGKPTGTTHDMKFAHDFMGIWLSKGTTDPDFRAKLLASN